MEPLREVRVDPADLRLAPGTSTGEFHVTFASFDRPAPNGVRKMRIVVRDAKSWAAGSLTIPLN